MGILLAIFSIYCGNNKVNVHCKKQNHFKTIIMANIIRKTLDAIFSFGESKQIREMRERARKRDNNEPFHKTKQQLQTERNITESMKINDEESRT